MDTIDIVVVIIIGIPIIIWVYHRIMFFNSPPYVKFEGYLRRKGLSWLLMVEDFIVWILYILFICAIIYVFFHI